MHKHNEKVQEELMEKIQRALDHKKNGDDLLSVKDKENLDLQQEVAKLKLELLQISETAAHRSNQLANEMDNENKKKQKELMDKLSIALHEKKNADELLAAKEKENDVLRTQLDELLVSKAKENITLQTEINNILEAKEKQNVLMQKANDEKNQLEMKLEEVLKTNAKIVSQKMRTEMLYGKQINEMEIKLKEKDDQIQSQQQLLEMFATPAVDAAPKQTATSVFGVNDYSDQEMKTVLQIVHNVTQNYGNSGDKILCKAGEVLTQRHPVTPSSRAMRVKARDDRKANRDENYYYEEGKREGRRKAEVNVSSFESWNQASSVEMKPIDVNANKKIQPPQVVDYIPEKDLNMFFQISEMQDNRGRVWDNGCYDYNVMVEDANMIIQDGDLTTMAINAFGSILMKRQQQLTQLTQLNQSHPTFSLGLHTQRNSLSYIFNSNFWEMNDQNKTQQLEDALPSFSTSSFMLFPVHHDNHWTLLVLNVKENEWNFYNS